jgi:hypothetical protein
MKTERAIGTPGEKFPWPKRFQLTAMDASVIAIPAAVVEDHEVLGAVIHCDDDAQFSLQSDYIFIRLRAGQSVWLEKSCQAIVIAEREGDVAARRFELRELP